MLCATRSGSVLLGVLFLTAFATPGVRADVLYATDTSGSNIYQVNTVAQSTTLFYHPLVGSVGDSLIFDLSGNIIYNNGSSTVRSYNPTSHVDSLIASGFAAAADIALEPGGKSILVSDFGTGKIYRVSLPSGTPVQFSTLNGGSTGANGITYDNTGRLFTVNGPRTVFNDSFVYQLDPTTGAIIKQSAAVNGLDGLAFDPFTGKLYATSYVANELYSVNPNTLAVTPIASISGPDGIAANGTGLLFIGSYTDSQVFQYNLTTQALTSNAVVPGQLDDLAPLSGLGSQAGPTPTAVPEPGTLMLVSTGLIMALGYRWQRRKALASTV